MTRFSGASRWPVRTVLVAAALAVCRLAHADDPPKETQHEESETHIQRGVELRGLGRNGEALVEFQRAYTLDQTPRARAQIALALQALGDWLGAEVWLEQALRGESDPWIEQYRSVLVGALATIRAHLGHLYIDVNVKEGEVLVDGVVVHSLPYAGGIHVKAGALDVEVRAPGFASEHRAVEVAAEADVHETFTLAALPPHDTTPAVGAAPDTSESRPRSAWGGYVALGGAGALAIGGVVAWRVFKDNSAIWNDDSQCQRLDESREQQCGSYRTTAEVALGAEIGAFTLAAASAGVGAWLLWPRRAARAAVAWCGPFGTVGMLCQGRF